MMICSSCGATNAETATACRMCDAPLSPPVQAAANGDMVMCPACRSENDADWLYCQHCGGRLPSFEMKTPTISEPGVIPITAERPQPTDLNEAQPEAAASPAMTQVANYGWFDEVKAAEAEITGPADPALAHPPPYSDYQTVAEPEESPAPEVPASPPRNQQPDELITTPDVIPPARMKCGSCGLESTGGVFCTSCGARFSVIEEKKPVEARAAAQLELITEGGKVGQSYAIEKEDTLIGRLEGELTFPHDVYLSGRHARVVERDGRYFLVDENSRNGTFIRITGEVELKPGDTFLIGKQVFRFGRSDA